MDTRLGTIEFAGDEDAGTRRGWCLAWPRRPPSPELCARVAFRSPQACIAPDPTGAAVRASALAELDSLPPSTRFGAAVPGSPALLHTPGDEPTDCRSCQPSIIAGL